MTQTYSEKKIYSAFFQRVNLSMFKICRVFLADFASPAGLYCVDGSLRDLSPEEWKIHVMIDNDSKPEKKIINSVLLPVWKPLPTTLSKLHKCSCSFLYKTMPWCRRKEPSKANQGKDE